MKRKVFSLCLLSTLLVGCGINNSKYSIEVISVFDQEATTYSINNQKLMNLVDSGFDIPVFFYSTTCSSCETSLKVVSDYAKEKKIQMYYYDVASNNSGIILEHYPSIGEYIPYPCLMLFKNKDVGYTMYEDKVSSKNNFSTIFKNHYSVGSKYSLTKLESLTRYIDTLEESYIVSYNSEDKNVAAKALDKCSNIEENILYLDSNYVENGVFDQLNTIFNIDYSGQSLFGYFNKKTAEWTAVNYMVE